MKKKLSSGVNDFLLIFNIMVLFYLFFKIFKGFKYLNVDIILSIIAAIIYLIFLILILRLKKIEYDTENLYLRKRKELDIVPLTYIISLKTVIPIPRSVNSILNYEVYLLEYQEGVHSKKILFTPKITGRNFIEFKKLLIRKNPTIVIKDNWIVI